MKKKIFSYFFTLFITVFILNTPFASANLKKRSVHEPMRTSVIVPCYSKHFQHLPELLNYYQNQTIPPDEIVISVSECGDIAEEKIEELKALSWTFHLTIILNKNKLSAGSNRNIASANSTGNLLICQDADDVPHPKRVEIIKYLFEHYYVDHLIHLWIPLEKIFSDYECQKLNDLSHYCDNPDILSFWSDNDGKIKGYITNGNVAYTREVSNCVQWPSQFNAGEDIEFNKAVYKHFRFKCVVNIELLIYRNSLSSYLMN